MDDGWVLNARQEAAAAHKRGPMMVLAGPGSGKTAVITHRALRLTRDHGIPPKDLLIVTFSKAAATQIHQRYLVLGGPEGITCGTFHAVFFRILRARFGCTAAQILSEDERRAAVRRLMIERGYGPDEELMAAVLNELSLVRNELYDERRYHAVTMGGDEFLSLLRAYESFKEENRRIDFDDMLCRCHTLLNAEPETLARWRKRYPFISVDEFQDINRVQYECLKMLAAPERNLFVVGDDDQSIYRFRGARPEFLLRFPKDFPDTQRVLLDINYRSANPIIACANQLILGNRQRYGKSVNGTGRTGAAPRLLRPKDQNDEAFEIAGQIKAAHRKGASYDSFAVIYRVNMQSRAFIDAFLNAHIRFQVKDESPSLYEHWVARDICAYLRLGKGTQPLYDPDAERVINKPFRYIGKAFLLSAKQANVNPLLCYTRDPALNEAQCAQIEELLQQLKTAGRLPPSEAIRYIRHTIGYDRYLRDHSAFRKLNPDGYLEVAAELQEAAKPFETADAFLNHAQETVAAVKQSSVQSEPCVTLTTMHSAKGLEFGTVYIAGVLEGVVPHERSKTPAELEEERRLLYVGMTRAKDALILSAPRTRFDAETKPSRFLTELQSSGVKFAQNRN